MTGRIRIFDRWVRVPNWLARHLSRRGRIGNGYSYIEPGVGRVWVDEITWPISAEEDAR